MAKLSRVDRRDNACLRLLNVNIRIVYGHTVTTHSYTRILPLCAHRNVYLFTFLKRGVGGGGGGEKPKEDDD